MSPLETARDNKQMSSTPTNSPHTVQQSLSEATDQIKIHLFPQGIHLRATYPSAFFERVLQARLFEVIVLNVSHALALLQTHGNIRSLLGSDCTLIVTETENDEILLERSQTEVWRLLEQIQPAIFIPDTGMVYREDPRGVQRTGVIAYRNRLEKITGRVQSEGWRIRVLPLLKGMRQEHFELLRAVFAQFEFRDAAFYAAPYASRHVGNAIGDLKDHLNNAITVLNPENILVLGQLGMHNLRQLPPRVTAAAGVRQFAKDFRGTNLSPYTVRQWQSEREQALCANTNTPTAQTMLCGGVR